MTRQPILVAAVTVGVLGWALPGGAQPPVQIARAETSSASSLRIGTLTAGQLEGVVADEGGRPLPDVAVSAFGPDTLFTLTDPRGRFTFSAVPIGAYLVRVQLPGYVASERPRVEVAPSGRTLERFTLARVTVSAATSPEPSVLAASFAGAVAASRGPREGQPSADNEAAGEEADDHSRAWRLRHARRSVLRRTDGQPSMADGGYAPPSWLLEQVPLSRHALGPSVAAPAVLANDTSLSGQFRLLTTSTFSGDGPLDWLAAEQDPTGIAYGTVGAPVGQHGRWEVQGGLSHGTVSSWILAGAYTRAPVHGHALNIGASVGTQKYDEATPAAFLTVEGQSRSVGAVHAFDRWTLSPRAMLTYGGRYAWHDYLEREGLFSPSMAFVFSPMTDTWIRAAVSQQMLAPGAEEFEPRGMTSFVLPPQRTFTPLGGAREEFSVERTRHVELGIEREMASFVLGVRRFEQTVDNQLVALFDVAGTGEPDGAELGHYRVANAGNLTTDGWTFSVARPVSEWVRGEVEYSVAHADWVGAGDRELLLVSGPEAVRVGHERIHDMTATVTTDVRETQTNIVAIYKVNSGFARRALEEESGRGLGYRFDVQVTQHLPFLSVGHARWEALVSVRNLFRETVPGSSLYDELLVVSPPKRMVGGIVVRF